MVTTIGVIGAGKLAPRMIRSLLDDQLEARDGEIELILPLSRKHFTDEVDVIIDWADKNDVVYDVITDPTTKDEDVEDLEVRSVIETAKGQVPNTIAESVAEKGGLLYVLWDDADDDGYAAFEKAYEAGVKCYDLVNGLEELTFDDPDEEEPPANAPDPVEEDPVEEEPDEEKAAPAKPEGEGINTRAEMMRMKVGPLKEMMAERGITLNREGKGRIVKGAYVDCILGFDETGHKVWMQEGDTAVPVDQGYLDEAAEYTDPEAEEVAEMVDAEESEVPADEAEPEVEVETGSSNPTKAEVTYTSGAGDTSSSGTSSTGVQNVTYTGMTVSATPRVTYHPAQAGLVATCAGCGGPVFALFDNEAGGFPEVRWDHADACPLAG